MAAAPLYFSREDLALFSAASLDRNPLHLSDQHARRSPFGARVVYGVLGGLAGLGQLTPERARPRSLVLDFPNPMLMEVPYQLELSGDRPERAGFKLLDGRRLLVRGTLQRSAVEVATPASWPSASPAAPEAAAEPTLQELQPGLQLRGDYQPDWTALAELARRWGLERQSGWSPQALAALIGCSYLVGMRLPGKQALFARLLLRLEEAAPDGPLAYQLRLQSNDARFDLLTMQVSWTAGGEPLASAELQAFFRPDVAVTSIEELRGLLPGDAALSGRTALVIGASRGLGAAIAQALVLRGAKVVATYQRSRPEAERLLESCRVGPGQLQIRQGDAADLGFLQSLRQELWAAAGGLDLLICNACPPLQPLWLEPASAPRIVEHVSAAVAMVSHPMSVFLESLAGRSGRCVVLSSSAVEAPVAEWPHYVSAKLALEGLVRVAALEFGKVGFLLVRPPRLLTDLTNTPLGRQAAMPPARVAAALVARLAGPGAGLELLEDFV